MAIRIIQWFLFALPLIVGTLGGIYSCADAYLDGRHFIAEIHFFKWVLCFIYVGIAVLAALAVGVLALAIRHKKLKAEHSVAKAVTLLAMGVMLSAIILVFQGPCYESGRNAAYASLDLNRLVEDCRQLDNRVIDPADANLRNGVMIVDHFSYNYVGLPAYLQSLHPLLVWKRDGVVTMQMDGGGIASPEGLVVDPGMSPEAFSQICRKNNLQLLNPSYPAAKYVGYDWRQAADLFTDSNQHPE
jgi:hypothetical protein